MVGRFTVDLVLATRRREITGIERYGISLTNALAEQGHDVIAFAGTQEYFNSKVKFIKVEPTFKSWLVLPSMMKKRNIVGDIIFPSFPPSPLFHYSSFRRHRIIHDAFPWTRGQAAGWKSQLMFKHLENFQSERYTTLFGTTDPVAAELSAIFNKATIPTSGNAVGIDLSKEGRAINELIGKKIVLVVGTLEPRKNYPRVVEVLTDLVERGWHAVVVGRRGWGQEDILVEQLVGRSDGRALWLSAAGDDELRWLYNNASAFLSLSYAEGFNMPLVEAGISGVPIVCSDLPIHRYVAPPWATFVKDQADSKSVADAIDTVSCVKKDEVEKYSSKYTWESIARNVSGVILEASDE